MPEEQSDFREAVKRIMEVVMFENWLRFYFIKEEKRKSEDGQEEADSLKLELPEKTLGKIEELYPHLYPLANELNGREIDFDVSRRAVTGYVLETLDGKKMPRGEAQRVFSSATFQTDLQLFHTWVQMHEDQLDQGFADFGSWQKMFASWKESPGAIDLAENIRKSASGTAS